MDDRLEFLFQKIDSQVFLGAEIIEQCALGDACLARNGLGCGTIKSLLANNSSAARRMACRVFSLFSVRRPGPFPSAGLRRGWLGLRFHIKI